MVNKIIFLAGIFFIFVNIIGCLPEKKANYKLELEEALKQYAAEYKEELILEEEIHPFLYPADINEMEKKKKSLKPLLEVMEKENVNVFVPVTSILVFHYPKDIKIISSGEEAEFTFWGVRPEDQNLKLGASHSLLKVIRRDNEQKFKILTADCAFLFIINRYGFPNETKLEWYYCKYEWDREKNSWDVKEAKKLSRGEQFFYSY